MAAKDRIMYIEHQGPDRRSVQSARIGRVSFSKTGRTIYYDGKTLQGVGRAQFIEVDTGDTYWITGSRKDAKDAGGKSGFLIQIDEDVRRQYWTTIREKPDRANEAVTYG